MVAPESLTVEDILVLLYKGKMEPPPLMRMDPWNDVLIAYIKQFDVPELDAFFAGRNWVTLAERIAFCVGDVADAAPPAPAAPAPFAAPIEEDEDEDAEEDEDVASEQGDAPDVPLIGGGHPSHGAIHVDQQWPCCPCKVYAT
jgi:hypothetical protein